MLELTTAQWITLIAVAVLIGFAKTGIQGAGVLIAPIMATILPAKQSTGVVLPMLILADGLAIVYWRRHVDWRHLVRLLPWTWCGVVIGFLCLGRISDRQLKPLIGTLVFVLLVLSWVRENGLKDDRLPRHWLFAAVMGLLAGSTSMMANAAGAVMALYLMAMRMPKNEFIGTQAWFFCILNLSKLPFSSRLGLISVPSLLTNLTVLPCIVAGGILGVLLVHRIPQRTFDLVVKALAAAAAVYLCLPL